jgi:hypothetical protein
MAFKCKIGLHKLKNCKCVACGKIVDDRHDWSKNCSICSVCGKQRNVAHDWSKEDCSKCIDCKETRDHKWNGCICKNCGITRDEEHVWNGCKCSKCSKTRNDQHDWSMDCEKCVKCGTIRENQHNWKASKCTKCGILRKRTLILENINDPPIVIDPNKITHAFIGHNHADIRFSNNLSEHIAEFNRVNQPKLWKNKIDAKFFTFSADFDENGCPEFEIIILALEKVGLKSKSSIVIYGMDISLDGGKTVTKIVNGFAFYDENPRIIADPRKNFIIPTKKIK